MRGTRPLGLVVAFMLAAVLSACSTPSAGPSVGTSVGAETHKQVDQTADGTTVQLTRGQVLDIELPSNPSAGYSWQLSGARPSQLASVTDSYEATGEPNVVGAGGYQVFSYSAAEAGTGTLKLDYVRPWETGVAPAKTFSITVSVQ